MQVKEISCSCRDLTSLCPAPCQTELEAKAQEVKNKQLLVQKAEEEYRRIEQQLKEMAVRHLHALSIIPAHILCTIITMTIINLWNLGLVMNLKPNYVDPLITDYNYTAILVAP